MAELNLEALAQMEYPGRFIIIGSMASTRPDGDPIDVVVYGLTGRSKSSQARVLKADSNREEETLRVFTEPTDPKVLEKGDPALLIYNAIMTDTYRAVVSNGAQTDQIWNISGCFEEMIDAAQTVGIEPQVTDYPINILGNYSRRDDILQHCRNDRTIDLACYEPDAPIFTPRVSGMLDTTDGQAALAIIKHDIDPEELVPTVEMHSFETEPGRGYLIATYDGVNPKEGPVPSFRGVGRPVGLGNKVAPSVLAEAVYEAMGDFAVGVAVVTPSNLKYAIKNLHNVD